MFVIIVYHINQMQNLCQSPPKKSNILKQKHPELSPEVFYDLTLTCFLFFTALYVLNS